MFLKKITVSSFFFIRSYPLDPPKKVPENKDILQKNGIFLVAKLIKQNCIGKLEKQRQRNNKCIVFFFFFFNNRISIYNIYYVFFFFFPHFNFYTFFLSFDFSIIINFHFPISSDVYFCYFPKLLYSSRYNSRFSFVFQSRPFSSAGSFPVVPTLLAPQRNQHELRQSHLQENHRRPVHTGEEPIPTGQSLSDVRRRRGKL